MKTTYSLIKVCNNCDKDNKEDAKSCRFCGLLLIGKENKARVYREFGKISPLRKKRPKTIEEIERKQKFGIKNENTKKNRINT